MSAPQLKALGKLTENIEMQSFTVENSPTNASTLRVTMWDRAGKHKILDIDDYGHGKVVESVNV